MQAEWEIGMEEQYFDICGDNAVIASDAIQFLVEELRELQAAERVLQTQIKEVKERIAKFMGDKEKLKDANGVELVNYIWCKPTETFDSKSFKEKHPNIYQMFVKIGKPVRRMLVK